MDGLGSYSKKKQNRVEQSSQFERNTTYGRDILQETMGGDHFHSRPHAHALANVFRYQEKVLTRVEQLLGILDGKVEKWTGGRSEHTGGTWGHI